ncbi:CYTH domain-containing protein [Kitasatospora atroaurantiaca]|uniref:Adenylate cyclase n=1 Tax=Kitasatospora atroaurantiaca TaxID=285545 RepID=A0A561EIF5_9ACTN|nr:CYTH domain-containing protein [Kitasatospora atroaurantiaca]TWE15398.1 adenylate cyclase [Kitasatospora atroaurantiaca]
MAVEIEKKYLLSGDGWRAEVVSGESITQGYLSMDREREVRVRLVGDGAAFLTVKGRRVGPARLEFEYPIPAADARELLALCLGAPLHKHRHHLGRTPGRWIVDEYTGANAGLLVAEVEWDEGQAEPPTPSWIGPDVSADPRYSNASLTRTPYTSW